jgi:hypothetical protein
MERFDRLGVPVNTGPADLREAQEEARIAKEIEELRPRYGDMLKRLAE